MGPHSREARVFDNQKPQLSLPRKLGFTVGDYAFNLYWQSVSLFLMFYYTDAVGLSASTAGIVYMLASIWDGITDPIMGAIADRTRTRWGRYRPYLLLAAVPLGLSFAWLYYKPVADAFGLTAIVLAAHFVFRTAYTISSIPYISLNARLTSSSGERSTLAGFRMIFASLAGLTVSFGTQPLVAYFGEGDMARGFFYVACVIGLIATAIFPIVFFSTREPAETGEEVPLRWREYYTAVRGNRAFWIVVLAVLGGSLCTTTLGKTVLYYFKYYLHDEANARYALTFKALAGLGIVASWVYVTRFVGKRNAWFLTSVWGALGLTYFLFVEVDTTLHAILFFVALHFCSIGISLTYWSMLPDTVEYGEWVSGHRAESLVFGLAIFAQKCALGLAAGVLGIALELVGFVPNVEQSAATLRGMKMIMVVFPMTGLALAAVAMLFYPLRPGIHERIVAELAARRRATP
jgi:glycoside/pentoside/hexuronide:cation symporter, GPH family